MFVEICVFIATRSCCGKQVIVSLSEAVHLTERLGNQKTDSTTVKTIAEPYLLASVNFYRTAIFIYMFC